MMRRVSSGSRAMSAATSADVMTKPEGPRASTVGALDAGDIGAAVAGAAPAGGVATVCACKPVATRTDAAATHHPLKLLNTDDMGSHPDWLIEMKNSANAELLWTSHYFRIYLIKNRS